MITNTIVSGSTVVSAKTAVGSVVSVLDFNDLGLCLDYTKGRESALYLFIYGMITASGDEFPLAKFINADGELTPPTYKRFKFDTSGKQPVMSFDVRGVNYVKVYQQANTIQVAAHSATFDVDNGAGKGTITAGSGTPYSVLQAGDVIVVSGTGDNDGTYTIDSVTDTVITTTGVIAGTDGVEANTVITVTPTGTFSLSYIKTEK